ncbi:MAG: universal stress protein [Pseudomonadota bacterium]|nr:universal stress protein [Pseudomonadota bacterium]
MNKASKDYRSLLATVDLGEMTEGIVAKAVDLGARCEAGVDLANVLEGMPVFLYHAVSSDELDAILEKSSRWSRERLDELKGRIPGIRSLHTASGVLAEEVRELAQRIGADLLVVGAHDRRGMAVLFRDRSDEILHRAACDVLVVKRGDASGSAETLASYRHLVAAVDLDGGGASVLERAARMAELYRAELTLVHVIDHFPVDRSNQVIGPEDRDPFDYARKEAEQGLGALADEAGVGDCRREVLVSDSTASREVPAFATANGADLIVIGSHGRHGLGRLLGSTADGILHRAACDLLVVRTQAET